MQELEESGAQRLEENNEAPEIKKASDYVPTPYRASQWEGIESVDPRPMFRNLAVEVLESTNTFDPMFDRFDVESFQQDNVEETADENPLEQIPEEVFEEIRKQAYEEGLAAGKELGHADAQIEIVEKYEALATSMKDITENIRNELGLKLEEIEKKSFELALEVSRRVLSTTAEAKPEYILDVIRNGLSHLGTSKPFKIRVSPDDFEFLEVVGLPEDLTLEGAKIKYLADENIVSGCVIETDFGELNLELDKMWSEIKHMLFKAVS